MRKISISLTELDSQNSYRPRLKARKSKVKGLITRKNLKRFKFLVKSTESYSSPNGHIVSILYPKIPLIQAYEGKIKQTPRNAEVKVWCTCQAWQYWGAAFNATDQKYNLDKIELLEPNIRDPKREYLVCKHVHASLRYIQRDNFKTLLTRFIGKYVNKQLDKMIGKPAKSSLDDDDLEMAEIAESLPAFMTFLMQQKGYTQAEAQAVINSVDESNFDLILLEHGAIV